MASQSPALHQYAKSVDPQTLAVIDRNQTGTQRFLEEGHAFASEHGNEDGNLYSSSFAGRHRIMSIASASKPTSGQWKKGPRGYGWVPYKNNPLHQVLDSITFDAESVPGLPGLVCGPSSPNGGRIVGTPRPFIVDGVAYYGFTFTPTEQDTFESIPEGGGWEEIKASEFHAAAEAHKAESSNVS